MAFKIAEVFVDIKGDKGKFSNTIRGAKRETAGFAKSATKNLKMIGIGLTAIGVAAAAAATIIAVKLTRAIIRAGASVVQTAIKYDKLRIGLIAVTGSAKEAGIQLNRLRILAESPGLGFEQAIQGSISLQAAGLSAALAEKSLSAFGNALAVVGKGAVELGRVNVQLAQIAAKTSGFGADIRVLKEAIPAIGPVLRKAFDGKPLEDVTITGKELIAVLVTGLNELGRAGDSVGNNINNLRTSFDLLKKTIGDTMLSITSDTAKTLTGIIDNITRIIPVWREYQDEVSEVFQKVAVIVIETTGEMMKGMFAIISAAAPLIFKPLTNSAKKFFRDFAAGFSVAVNDVMKFFRVINQQQADTFLAELIHANQDANNKAAANFKKEYEAAIKSAVNVSIKELPRIGKVFGESLSEILALTKTITDKIPKAIVEPTKKAAAELKTIDLAAAFKTLGMVIDFNKKGFAEFGRVAGIHLGNIGVKIGEARSLANEFGEAARDELERIAEQARRTAAIIAPAFENMFTSLFSGNTKNLWQNFWSDLKRIAIREMATIFATQLVAGLLTGGTSFAAAGAGALLGGLAPRSIDPTSRAIAGGVGRAVGAVASFLENGTIIIQDQDLGNFDVQRLTKQVEQGIAPALAEASADGIQ